MTFVAQEPEEASTLQGPYFLLLLLAVLAVAMTYGVTLPLLPMLIERMSFLSPGAVARHTGLLTAAYTLALFVFSPIWGAASDRLDRRAVIAMGLCGTSLALWGLEAASTLQAMYVLRAVAGFLAAAVLPAVLAYVVTMTAPGQRKRRFAWVASASALGFLLGPFLGESLKRMLVPPWMLDSPFVIVAAIAVTSAVLTFRLPREPVRIASIGGAGDRGEIRIWNSLWLTLIVVFGITVAEVGLTLQSRSTALILERQVPLLFGVCSVVMVAMQMWGYPRLEDWLGEGRLVRLSLAVMGGGLLLLARPSGLGQVVVAFVLSASAIGVLIPALAVRISLAAGDRQGWALGRQTAAANLGQAMGAGAAGILYASASFLPFVATALLLLLCAAMSGQRRGAAG